jgi:hypothetical protein
MPPIIGGGRGQTFSFFFLKEAEAKLARMFSSVSPELRRPADAAQAHDPTWPHGGRPDEKGRGRWRRAVQFRVVDWSRSGRRTRQAKRLASRTRLEHEQAPPGPDPGRVSDGARPAGGRKSPRTVI